MDAPFGRLTTQLIKRTIRNRVRGRPLTLGWQLPPPTNKVVVQSANHSERLDWYLQRNDRGCMIGDPGTGSCDDCLMAHGVNVNTGAESALSFSLAYQSLIRLAGGKTKHADSLTQSDKRPSAG